MRKIITILLVAMTAATTISAQRKQQVNTPTNVIDAFNFICDLYGQKDSQVYSIIKNPNTGIIESKEVITPFVCDKDNLTIQLMASNFHENEPMSYQFMHLTPGNVDNFSIKVVTSNGMAKTVPIRSNRNQEMWYMATKNPDNPQLRDVYAIVWESKDAEDIAGKIFMISSLRPDIYQQDLETSSKTFKIEGRIDGEIKDSLYNVYIADSYEELNSLADDDYVACVPIINKRFEYSVELDKPKAGRIRCIFPDGSLCSAWINLDMVPGETYRITVHNGYFDEDRDYERRVGRYSGKSLIVGHDNDDASSPVVIDEKGNVVESPFVNLTEEQVAIIQSKAEAIGERIQLVTDIWENGISKVLTSTSSVYQNGKRKNTSDMDTYFEQIIKQNEQIDKQFGDLIQTLNGYGCEKKHIAQLIKDGILDFLSKQNKAFIDIYGHLGSLSKVGTKCQKQVNKLTEKYLDEMGRLF